MKAKLQLIIVWVALGAIGMLLTSCQRSPEAHIIEHPAVITKIDGSNISKVTLSSQAMKRIALKTEPVTEVNGKRVVPFSSLIYDPQGQTWVYISPRPGTFIRKKIDVAMITDGMVVLNDGPDIGTRVVTVAVAELYGTEFEVGH